jgi:hypothetical protein
VNAAGATVTLSPALRRLFHRFTPTMRIERLVEELGLHPFGQEAPLAVVDLPLLRALDGGGPYTALVSMTRVGRPTHHHVWTAVPMSEWRAVPMAADRSEQTGALAVVSDVTPFVSAAGAAPHDGR